MRSTGVQAVLLVTGGLALAWLVATAPPLFAVGAATALLFGLTFLNRPDTGVLLVMVIRASSDATLQAFQGGADTGSVIGQLVSPNSALILIVIIVGGIVLLSRGLPILSLPAGRLLALLVLTGLVGVVRAPSQLQSANEWLPVVSVLVVYALAANLFREPTRPRQMVNVLALSFVIPALVGLRQIVMGQGRLEGSLVRINATFVHPNTLAFYLVIIVSVFLCEVLTQTGWRRATGLLILAISAVLLLFTFTRVAWVGVIVVFLVVGVLRSRLLLLLLPAIAGAAYFFVPAIGERLADPLGGSFADRLRIWGVLIGRWIEVTGQTGAPIAVALDRLTGLGPGAFFPLLAPVTRAIPHNDYLRVMVEYGVLGVLLFIAAYAVLIITTYSVWRRAQGEASVIALAFLGIAFAFPVMSLTDNLFAMTVNQVYFWTLAGMVVAIGETLRAARVRGGLEVFAGQPPVARGALSGELTSDGPRARDPVRLRRPTTP